MSNEELNLREAKRDDIPFLTAMYIDAAMESLSLADVETYMDLLWNERYIDDFPREGEFGIIAEDKDNNPLGAIWVRVNKISGEGELTLGIVESHRRKGIGTILLHEICVEAALRGFDKLLLSVRYGNIPAIRLYEKEGWKETGTLGDFIVMSRMIF